MKTDINYVLLNSHITVPSPRKAFWIYKIHPSYNQHDALVASIVRTTTRSVLTSAAETGALLCAPVSVLDPTSWCSGCIYSSAPTGLNQEALAC